MLIGEIIQRVQSKFSAGVQSDSVRLSNRHVYNLVISTRNTLFDQASKKKQYISSWNFQTIPCAELIEVPAIECNLPISLGTVQRTKYKVPRPLTNLNSHMIMSVMTMGGKRIDFSEQDTFQYRKGNKYTANRYSFFIKNEYGWLVGEPKQEAVIIGPGLFEDPIEVHKFPTYCGESVSSCTSYLDLEFPGDSDMIGTLVDMVSNELIDAFGQGMKTKDLKEQQPDN